MSSKSKNFIFSIVPLILVWLADLLSKQWAKNLDHAIDLGIVKLELIYNHGVMMGWLSHVPLSIKTTVMATIGAMILCFYIFFALIIPVQSIWMRIGPAILIGGIIGNVTDRLSGIAVVDFITHQTSFIRTPYYNLADFFQWLGYVLIIVGMYQDSKNFWHKENLRNKFFINRIFQIRCGSFLATFNFLVGFVLIIFGYAFFRDESNINFEGYYFACSFLILIFLCLVGFVLGVFLSHRVAGPIYALVKYMDDSFEDKKVPFKLRDHDEFKELEEICTKWNNQITKLNEK